MLAKSGMFDVIKLEDECDLKSKKMDWKLSFPEYLLVRNYLNK
jgi:hypothetical protein